MAYMNVKYLVIVLSFAVVRCADPDCTSPACTGTKTCKWTCDTDAGAVIGANRSDCTAEGHQCGTKAVTAGKCKAACVEPAGTPVCTAPVCTPPATCTWTCDESGTAIRGADLDVCVAPNTACGSTTQTGQCKAACVSTGPSSISDPVKPDKGKTGSTTVTTTTVGKTGKNGSIRHGLSPLMLICGIFNKMFLLP